MQETQISKLSVIIHTKNAAATIERTLQSLSFAQEIIIIDMESSDETRKIARQYTSKIFTVDDVGYADPARNFGISKAFGPWILVIDADEVVPQSLRDHLPKLIESETVNCYYVPRKNIIFDKWIEKTGWWPDYQARLFRKGTVHWEVGVHKQPILDGEVVHLPAKDEYSLVHYNYDSISHFIQKLNTYTSITAQEHVDADHEKSAKDAQHTTIEAIRTFKAEFLRRLFAQDGLEDKTHGVALSFLQSMYQLTVVLKKWEVLGYPSDHTKQRQTILELREFARELEYWTADWEYRHATGIKKLYWQIKRKLSS